MALHRSHYGSEAHGRDRFAVQRQIEELFRLDDEEASELLLVRHAEPATRSANGHTTSDPLLSCTGLIQAERLAERLRFLWAETIFTAQERRAYQTAALISEATGRPLQTLDALRDIEFEYDGLAICGGSYSQRFASQPRWDALPGFAHGVEFRRRAIEAIESAIAAHPGRRVVVITHSSVINAFLSMLWDVPRDVFFAPDHASICVVRSQGDLQAIRTLNDTSHLEGLICGW
ncbi:MAG TPA: histidine phosphatase family protein [Dehalococcoidia bacterium]|nr:histidine phosphatase family protein [Dehalococcoidia bacterium]